MKDDNKSLFLYTGLIFLVAIMLILLSFFGQSKFDEKTLPDGTRPSGWGIDKKAAVISEENMVLNQQLAQVNEQLAERDIKITELTAANNEQSELLNNYNIIVSCYSLCKEKKYTEAKEKLLTVNTEILSPEMRALYDELIKETE